MKSKRYTIELYICIVLFFSILSCSSDDSLNKPNLPVKYSIATIDTLSVSFKGRLITAIDYNRANGNMLFCDIARIDTICQTDSQGNLQNKKTLLGEGAGFAGTAIYNFGYFDDSTIVINGSNGFLFLDLNFELKKIIDDKTPLLSYGSGTTTRIKNIERNQKKLGILHLKHSFSGEIFSKEGYEKYKAVTVYDFEDKKHTFVSGYEKESIFINEKVQFGNPLNFFDIYKDSLLFSIHSPDLNLYIYNLHTKEGNYYTSKLCPSHFSLPISYKLGQLSNDNLDPDIVNSQFTDINCYQDLTFISYRTGIAIDEFKKVKTSSEFPELFKNHMKYFTIILEKGKQTTADIQLMKGGAGIAFIKSLDYILVNTNPVLTETETKTNFFICKLSSISK